MEANLWKTMVSPWLSAFERFHVPCLVEMSLGSPLPHPVAVPEACRLARSPPWDQKQGQARLDCPCAAPRPPAL
ncbi:hypothetical protein T4C_5677 [Trichinella pseudospiralis]|uniref:Uncharacterized protein n=1 Tax=Trichinella pseudospiralis TaxID=6337 RepID=A0A0V1H473_TRIPS|nr:hypothetical protein T4C_5677 [Trichinella pseudospiralis]